MVDRKIRNLTSDYLTCTICWNIFTDPKMLQCGHSYCAKCLEDYLRSMRGHFNTFECPVCRQPQEIEVNTDPALVIRSLSTDLVSLSILNAIGLQKESLVNENSKEYAKIANQDETKTELQNKVSPFSTCARHRQKLLDVYCSKHEIVVCSECAVHDHSEQGCDCLDVGIVIGKRLSALKCLFAQQAADASRLFQCTNPGARTIKGIYDDFQRSVSEVEDSFVELYQVFRERIKDIRTKAKDIIEKDLSSVEVRRLQELLMTKIKSFEEDTVDLNPNATLRVICELCSASSDLQENIHHLTEKIKTGSLMQYAEGDLNLLDAYVSTVRQTLPEKVKTFEEMYNCDQPDDKEFVMVTKSGQFADLVDDVNEEIEISQHFSFSAICNDESQCNISSVAILGTTAVVVVDQNNKKLKKFKLPEGRFLSSLKLEMKPHQATTLRESSDVAVTVWETRKVLIVSSDPTIQILKVIDTSVEYIGIISHLVDRIAVSSIQTRRVDVLDTRDNQQSSTLQTIYQSSRRKSFPDRLAATADSRIIVHKCRANEVCCFGRQHALLWSRRLKSSTADIACLRGKVFATIRDKEEIICFDDNGQGDVKTLKLQGTLTKPWAIDGFKNCLVVSEDVPSAQIHVIIFV